MGGEEVAKEKSKVLNELLVRTSTLCINGLQVHREGNDFGDFRKSVGVHLNEFVIVRRICLQAGDLCQTLEGDVSKFCNFKEPATQCFDKADSTRRGLEDVSKGYPVQKS